MICHVGVGLHPKNHNMAQKWSIIRTNLTFDFVRIKWPTSYEIESRDEMKCIQRRFAPLVSVYVQKIIIFLKKGNMIRTTLTFDSFEFTWPKSYEIEPRDEMKGIQI